jgi:hypothetical protein
MRRTLELISIEEAARIKDVSQQTINAAIRRGALDYYEGISSDSLASHTPNPLQQSKGRRSQAQQRFSQKKTKREDSQYPSH